MISHPVYPSTDPLLAGVHQHLRLYTQMCAPNRGLRLSVNGIVRHFGVMLDRRRWYRCAECPQNKLQDGLNDRVCDTSKP